MLPTVNLPSARLPRVATRRRHRHLPARGERARAYAAGMPWIRTIAPEDAEGELADHLVDYLDEVANVG